MDEQTRTHCRIDLHKVQNGAMTAAAFIASWGRDLDDHLLNPPENEDAPHPDDLREAQETSSRLKVIIKDAATEARAAFKAIDRLANDIDGIADALETEA